MMQRATGSSAMVVLPYVARSGVEGRGKLSVRALTGSDELAIDETLAAGSSAAAAATLLIGRCAMDESGTIGSDAAQALVLGDREVVLRAAYAATFDETFAARVACPSCGAAVELDIDLTTLAETPPEAGPLHRMAAAGGAFRVPTGGDLERALQGEGDDFVDALVGACIDDGDSDPEMVAAEFLRIDPNAECALAMICPDCDAAFEAYLDAFELVRSALADGGGIVRQVDCLASAYGWSEPEILSLPRARRLRYCALVEGRDPV